MIEIVSKPDIASPEEAYAYLEQLRQIVQFTGVSDVKMEEGSMRLIRTFQFGQLVKKNMEQRSK